MTLNNTENIYGLFEEQAKKSPDRTALSFDNSGMTYLELSGNAKRTAGILKESGMRKGDIAAVNFASPVEMVVGIMGVLEAGGTYLPLPSSYPPGRINDILEYSGVKYLLTHGSRGSSFAFAGKVVFWDGKPGEDGDDPGPIVPVNGGSPFTVIYSSNSSGKPEGMILSHQKIRNWIKFNLERLKADFSRTLFVLSSRMETDFPLWLVNLVTGGTVYFYSWKDNPGIPGLRDLLEDNNIKSVVCPVRFLKALIPGNNHRSIFTGNLANIISMGEEVFEAGEFKKFLKETKIKWHNYYDFPGMNMITTLAEDGAGDKSGFKHMGRPGPDTHVYILDRTMLRVPIGMTGELYVSGSGVTDGYFRDEELNRSHFVESPVVPGTEIFKTGCEVNWLPDGKIVFHGRIDNLVNIDGSPIALEEVENALFKHPSLEDCAVGLKGRNENGLRLTAYMVLKEDIPCGQIEAFLKNLLPIDIFPIGFVRLSSIPRTADGDVDRGYLEKTGYFDTIEVGALEKEIKEEKEIEHAAVLIKEKIERPAPLYLKDFLPEPRKPVGTLSESEPLEPGEPGQDEAGYESKPLAVIQGKELEVESGDPRTLAEALEKAAGENRDNGIVYIQADGSEGFQSYPELLEEAERVLAGLRNAGLKPGDKVIFQFNRSEDYISAFWGCQLGGIVPVPITVPKSFSRSNMETMTLYNIWQTLRKPYVLTDASLAGIPFFREFRVETIERLRENEPDKNRYKSSPGDIALLLFTSGSTGKPKGVKQTHRSLLAREKATALHNRFDSTDVSVNWMPLEHVGGVVMFHLRDVWLGCSQVQVRVDYILTEPLRWLDIISGHKATITWAPNFAFALVNEKLEERRKQAMEEAPGSGWDLSSMKFILNGGEAINAAIAKKFLELLAPYGLPSTAMKPAWGMSETCSGIVYSHSFAPGFEAGVHHLDRHSPGGPVKTNTQEAGSTTFVELGKTVPGVSIRVADPGNRVLKEGIVGRLQVKGLPVTMGYYENPELNDEVFTSDGWFDTGDLGFILNGAMTITGRAKDVIIINGINYNNVEIEAVVEEVDGVETSYTAACAVRDANNETDRIVIFYNSVHGDFHLKLEQIREIRKTFAEKIGLNPDFVIPVDKHEIPKTSIGKIQRAKLAKLFESGHFGDIVKQVEIGLAEENTLPAWFFKKTWHRRSFPVTGKRLRGNNCLIFTGDSALSDALISRLEDHGCNCIGVKPGRGFKKINDNCYEINTGEPGDYNRMFETLYGENIRIHDIFYLYVSGESRGMRDDADIIKDVQSRAVYGLLRLIQAQSSYMSSHRWIRLFAVTAGAQKTSANDKVSFETCALPGFLRTVSLELPWLRCSHIDLEPAALSTESRTVESLLREWQSLKTDSEVAYREGERLLPLLSRLDMEKEANLDLPLEQGSIYLVTGGLGGIGTHVCKWLLKNYRAKLIIVGRTSLPERNRWADHLEKNSDLAKRLRGYLEIESLSSDFMYGEGDVCDKAFLTRLIAGAESRWKKSISGVFHLAGFGSLEYHWTVMDKHWAAAEIPETFEAMFHPKVYGAIMLHQVLRDRPGAIFAAFSSTTALFGAATFSAYSAANSLLDGFCFARRDAGYPNTYCLNWSSWEDVGMSENNPPQMKKAMLASGYEIIPPALGLNSLLIALRCKPDRFIIGLDSGNTRIRYFLDEYPPEKQSVNVYYTVKNGMEFPGYTFREKVSNIISRKNKSRDTLLESVPLETMPLNEGKIDYKRLEEIDINLKRSTVEFDSALSKTQKLLIRIWKEILGKAQIGVDDDFFELGGNSLKATTLVSHIHKKLNTEVPLAEIFRAPTIRELSGYIDAAAGVTDSYDSIEPAKEKDYYALSSAQKRLYVLQQMKPDSTTYNLPQVLELAGEPGREKLAETFKKLIQRHESLRTSFDIVDSEPVQRIYNNVEFKIEYYNRELSTVSNFIRPFDLSQAPLLRVGLIRTGEAKYILVTDMHHIIADGVSHNILTRDFIAFYRGEELPALRIQYKDYSEWQNRMKEKGKIKTQEEYWIKQFEGEIPVLDLPADYSRPDELSFEGSTVEFDISEGETGALEALAKEEGATMYMAVLALFNILLGKLTGREDIVVGTDTAGRRHADLENIIGMFVNTLVLRNYPEEDKTFTTFLREVKQRTLEAFENQDYQFENLVEKVVVKRDAGRNPLFDIMFTYYNMAVQPGDIPGLKIKQWDYEEKKTAKFDLIFHAAEIGRGIHCTFEYSTKLFKKEKIKKYIKTFKEILSAVMENKEIKLKDIPVTHSLMAIESNILLEDQGEFGF